MIRPLIASALLATTAHAQTTEQLESSFGPGDTATLHMETQWHGVLTYNNDGSKSSQGGTWAITDNGVTCHLTIVVGSDETASVHCDGQYAPHVDEQDVPDGETFDFHIMYLGG